MLKDEYIFVQDGKSNSLSSSVDSEVSSEDLIPHPDISVSSTSIFNQSQSASPIESPAPAPAPSFGKTLYSLLTFCCLGTKIYFNCGCLNLSSWLTNSESSEEFPKHTRDG
jgi:hypothetical protein